MTRKPVLGKPYIEQEERQFQFHDRKNVYRHFERKRQKREGIHCLAQTPRERRKVQATIELNRKQPTKSQKLLNLCINLQYKWLQLIIKKTQISSMK